MLNDLVIVLAFIFFGALCFMLLDDWLQRRELKRLKAQYEAINRQERQERRRKRDIDRPIEWEDGYADYLNVVKLGVRHESPKTVDDKNKGA